MQKELLPRHIFSSLIPLWNRLPETVASATSLEDFRSKLAEIHIKQK